MKKKVDFKVIFIHLAFWSASFFILFRIFTKDYNNGTVDFIYTLLFHVPIVLLVYTNIWLIKKYLAQRKYWIYATGLLVSIFLGTLLHFVLFDVISKYLLKGYYFISLFSHLDIAAYLFAYAFVSLLIQLSSEWYLLREKQMRLEKEHKEVQLSNLKAQLNPHFLFNSLNNIYALSNSESRQGKDYIIKLSDALRFMLYKTQSKFIPLQDELGYLKNYVELERLRLEEGAHVNFSNTVEETDLKIAPLLLLPLVENCFKHCNKSSVFIDINISFEDNRLQMLCVNNIAEIDEQDDAGGIGLVNMKKRLEMIYPGNYSWEIDKDGSLYSSKIKIELKR